MCYLCNRYIGIQSFIGLYHVRLVAVKVISFTEEIIFQKDELGYTALHHAAIAGLRDVTELLVEVGEDVDAKGQDGSTPLRCAVQEGHARVVETLLARGASFLDKDEDGLTMLHCAASEGHEAVVRLILSHAPWLANEQSWSGWTPLHSAAVMGHSQVVSLLLHNGANPRSDIIIFLIKSYISCDI